MTYESELPEKYSVHCIVASSVKASPTQDEKIAKIARHLVQIPAVVFAAASYLGFFLHCLRFKQEFSDFLHSLSPSSLEKKLFVRCGGGSKVGERRYGDDDVPNAP